MILYLEFPRGGVFGVRLMINWGGDKCGNLHGVITEFCRGDTNVSGVHPGQGSDEGWFRMRQSVETQK